MGVWRQVRPHPNPFWKSVVVMKLINHPAAQSVLDELHSAASDDKRRWADRTDGGGGDNARGGGDLVRLGEFYLSVSPEEGAFLYVLARAINAKKLSNSARLSASVRSIWRRPQRTMAAR